MTNDYKVVDTSILGYPVMFSKSRGGYFISSMFGLFEGRIFSSVDEAKAYIKRIISAIKKKEINLETLSDQQIERFRKNIDIWLRHYSTKADEVEADRKLEELLRKALEEPEAEHSKDPREDLELEME